MIVNGEKYLVETSVTYVDSIRYDAVFGICDLMTSETKFLDSNEFLKIKGDNGEILLPLHRVSGFIKTNNIIENKNNETVDEYRKMRILYL